ncbi:MAG: 30S ribosomal protein S16 [Nitrospirales bacterium]|nr:30S ribosomal protein S16 [Nitrospirales bacterium]
MAVHLRLSRIGRHKRPFYRVVAIDSRKRRDGRCLEVVGTYDPLKESVNTTFKEDRVLEWLRHGAQPSVTVRTLLKRSGILKTFEDAKKTPAPAS